jgi:rod shape determining protein RodA
VSSVHRIRIWPWIVPLCTGLLMLAGLAGISRGDELSTGAPFIPRQLMWIGISLPALLVPLCVHYRRLKSVSFAMYAVTLVLLCVVFFCPPRNGARGWIPLGFADFQPSEVMKLALIVTLARYLMYR